MKKERLTQAKLKELLDYDPETGVFVRKIATGRHGCHKKGEVSGGLNSDGYVTIAICGKRYRANRLAFLWMDGYFPEHDAEHKDRNRANNKWSNLREASRACNMRNIGVRSDNKSGVTGVFWYERDSKWEVQLRINGKKIHIGRFGDFNTAVQARWQAEKKYGWAKCNTKSSAKNYLKKIASKRSNSKEVCMK